MTNKTNMKNILKILPLSAVLAACLAFSPALSWAENGDRGHHKQKHSVNVGKQHNKVQHRNNKQSVNRHGKSHKINHRRVSKHHDNNMHDRHSKYAYYKPGHHNHRYDHDHRGHSHSHTRYVVNDHYHSDSLPGLDHLRFMIGLHTDNFDIILRE